MKQAVTDWVLKKGGDVLRSVPYQGIADKLITRGQDFLRRKLRGQGFPRYRGRRTMRGLGLRRYRMRQCVFPHGLQPYVTRKRP